MMSHSDSQSDKHSGGNSGGELSGDTSGNASEAQKDKTVDFGSLLAEARKAKNQSIDDVSEFLKIPADTISAIENSDNQALPAPTYTKGYIRAYAKFLEISEDRVLEIYNRAMPHDDVSDLKPRSNLPGETNSQSPLIKTITILLILAGIAAVIFGSFQYYQKKAGDLESELDNKQQDFTGNSLDSLGDNRFGIRQNARLTDDGELILQKQDVTDYATDYAAKETGEAEITSQPVGAGAAEIEQAVAVENETKPAVVQPSVRKADQTVNPTAADVKSSRSDVSTFAGAIAQSAENSERGPAANQSGAGSEKDILEIFAENGSWVEVRDANNTRLLYNMLPAGSSKVLVGSAPFSISMGNAKTTRVVVNDLDIDVTKYIRASNTASFKVSTQGQNVIFH